MSDAQVQQQVQPAEAADKKPESSDQKESETQVPLDIQLITPPVKQTALEVQTSLNEIMEVDAKDLALMDQRVSEIERYLGIEEMDLKYFYEHDGEDLNKKSHMLEDFMRIVEERSFCMKELYQKYEKMESFLKHNEPFADQCSGLKQKSNFVVEQMAQLEAFLQMLEQIKLREKYLGFDPIVDPYKTLAELKTINLEHSQHVMQSEEQAQQVDELLVNYNEIVERINEHVQTIAANSKA